MINLDFLKKKKTFVKHSVQPDPNRYWILIFCLGTILTLASFAFGFYLFTAINTEEAAPNLSGTEQLEKISKARIDKVLEIFSEKEKASNKILNSKSPVVDPSL